MNVHEMKFVKCPRCRDLEGQLADAKQIGNEHYNNRIAKLETENEQLTTGFESLRQSLSQMQPDFEQAKAELAAAIERGAFVIRGLCTRAVLSRVSAHVSFQRAESAEAREKRLREELEEVAPLIDIKKRMDAQMTKMRLGRERAALEDENLV